MQPNSTVNLKVDTHRVGTSILCTYSHVHRYIFTIEANKVKFVPRDSLGSVACEHASRKCCLLELAAVSARSAI